MSKMMEYVHRLYSGYDMVKDLATDAAAVTLCAGTAGFVFRNGFNYFFGPGGMTNSGIPMDEYLRPPAVYIMTYLFDRLTNSKYHIKLSAGVCVGWEFVEHMTPISDIISFIGPTLAGSAKDFLMDGIGLILYPILKRRRRLKLQYPG